jgi:GTPase involved in cell partitioning and DNA repair
MVLVLLINSSGQFPKQSNKFNQFIEKNETKLVIYVISLSEYNQSGKLMEESLKAFEKAISMKELKDLPWIIVFNKLDILEQKEVKFPMRYYFNDFQDDMDSVKYLSEKYLEKIKTLEHKVEILWCYDQNGVVRIIKLIEEYITKFLDKNLYF